MDNKNYIYGLIFSIIFLIGVTAIVSYGYIGSRGQASGKGNLTSSVLSPSELLSITGDTSFSLNISLANLSILNANNNGSKYIDNTKSVNIVISANPTIYTSSIKCEYQIYYQPTTAYTATAASISNNLVELGFTGTNGTNTFGPISISGVTTKTLLYSGSITSNASTGQNTQTWSLSYRFYNLNIDQQEALGKSPAGKIIIEGKSCYTV